MKLSDAAALERARLAKRNVNGEDVFVCGWCRRWQLVGTHGDACPERPERERAAGEWIDRFAPEP